MLIEGDRSLQAIVNQLRQSCPAGIGTHETVTLPEIIMQTGTKTRSRHPTSKCGVPVYHSSVKNLAELAQRERAELL